MAKTDKQILDLLKELRQLEFYREEKESYWEVLVDFLEIAAVAIGMKPCHLQGHGLRSGSLIKGIERIVKNHELYTLKTQPLARHWPRAPAYEQEYYQWQVEQDKKEAAQSPPVLWVYRNPSLEDIIHRTVSGEINVSAALGYPECCVYHHDEQGVRLSELLVEGYKNQHGARSVEDLIHLAVTDAEVEIDGFDLPDRLTKSRAKFRYAQITACPPCLNSNSSPAAEINWAMRRLARRLSPHFLRQIDRAIKEEK